MCPIDARKLAKLQEIYGDMTAVEALDEAIENERLKNLCTIGDLAWLRFAREQKQLESLAFYLEAS